MLKVCIFHAEVVVTHINNHVSPAWFTAVVGMQTSG